MKFIATVFTLASLLFLFSWQTTKAQEFYVDTHMTYEFKESGDTLVRQNIKLENAQSSLLAKSFVLSLSNIDVYSVNAYESNQQLETNIKREDEKTSIRITFDDSVVGMGSVRDFNVEYMVKGMAKRTGEVWEIVVPSVTDKSLYRNLSYSVVIPKAYGPIAYVDPNTYDLKEQGENRRYDFDQNHISESGIVMAFGNLQAYSFLLNYHLENPLPKNSDVEITIPPDTAFQKVYIEDINPKPKEIKRDKDGNWLAVFNLGARERVDVVVAGTVELYSAYQRNFSYPGQNLQDYLKETEYWQTSDPEIIRLANELKTPRAIYDYVVNNLNYDYSRVRSNVQRLGAVEALKNPNSAICMEFTDAFIAIARAAGIPAREVNGYAYTENPEIQPLSLVADVLHAWPEYWDESKGVWIPVDPTWGATSGNDFFEKIDLRHFTFVIHGIDPVKPYPPGSYKLGSNPQKDVFVNFAQSPNKTIKPILIEIERGTHIPFLPQEYFIKVYNPGPNALYNHDLEIYFDDSLKEVNTAEFIAPYSTYTLSKKTPFNLIGENIPNQIGVKSGFIRESIATGKVSIIITNLLSTFTILTVVVLLFLVKIKKFSFKRFLLLLRRTK